MMFDFNMLSGLLAPEQMAAFSFDGLTPSLTSPGAAITSPLTATSLANGGLGMPEMASFLNAGQGMPNLTGGGMTPDIASRMMGLASRMGGSQSPTLPRAPSGGLAMGQMQPQQLVPGARMLRR